MQFFNFEIHVYKVLKQVHPDTRISSKAMGIMNFFVNYIFERIVGSSLAHYNKSQNSNGCEAFDFRPSMQFQNELKLLPNIITTENNKEKIIEVLNNIKILNRLLKTLQLNY